jgi:hypothetical protein
VASSFSTNGKEFYVGSADRGLLLRIQVNTDGTAGSVVAVGQSLQHTVEGVFFHKKKVYFGSVFANGTNLTPDLNGQYQGGVLAGNSIWITDLETGVTSQFYDERLGAVCSISSAQGVIANGANKLFVVSSAFDSFPYWPQGLVRSGHVPYGSIATGPALPNSYNAKIWILDLD